jgi:hypothetical protein
MVRGEVGQRELAKQFPVGGVEKKNANNSNAKINIPHLSNSQPRSTGTFRLAYIDSQFTQIAIDFEIMFGFAQLMIWTILTPNYCVFKHLQFMGSFVFSCGSIQGNECTNGFLAVQDHPSWPEAWVQCPICMHLLAVQSTGIFEAKKKERN